jgi:hypothetical protein
MVPKQEKSWETKKDGAPIFIIIFSFFTFAEPKIIGLFSKQGYLGQYENWEKREENNEIQDTSNWAAASLYCLFAAIT